MKYLTLFALLIPFSLFAQIQVEDRKAAIKSETKERMVKVSSGSEMSIQMMDIMGEETNCNVEEMNKIASSISNNPDPVQIIAEATPERAGIDDLSVDPLGLKKDVLKVGEKPEFTPLLNQSNSGKYRIIIQSQIKIQTLTKEINYEKD